MEIVKEIKRKDSFYLKTALLAAIIAILYVFYSFENGWKLGSFLIIGMQIIYIIAVYLWRQPGFIVWSIANSLILLINISLYPTTLYNNYTALFLIFIVILIKNDLKRYLLMGYAIAVSIIFLIFKAPLIYFLIHIARGIWLYYVLNFIITNRYIPKTLDLTDDEIQILEELKQKKLLKACDSFSKNTITLKLKQARERNGIDNNAELLAQYNLIKKK